MGPSVQIEKAKGSPQGLCLDPGDTRSVSSASLCCRLVMQLPDTAA